MSIQGDEKVGLLNPMYSQKIGDAVLRDYMRKAGMVYKEGMTKDEFKSKMLGDTEKAPKWLHDLLDVIWDFFS